MVHHNLVSHQQRTRLRVSYLSTCTGLGRVRQREWRRGCQPWKRTLQLLQQRQRRSTSSTAERRSLWGPPLQPAWPLVWLPLPRCPAPIPHQASSSHGPDPPPPPPPPGRGPFPLHALAVKLTLVYAQGPIQPTVLCDCLDVTAMQGMQASVFARLCLSGHADWMLGTLLCRKWRLSGYLQMLRLLR